MEQLECESLIIDAKKVHEIIGLFNLEPSSSGDMILNLCDKQLKGDKFLE